jgi:tRNA U34 2-thiouridine synthase MnmA/TrmU
MKQAKALVLFSGGLDSMLAAKILEAQGIGVTLACFESYFFSCMSAKKAADEIGLPLRAVDISKEQLEIVKHPRFGRGGAVNPCIDCHLLMLAAAKKIMEAEGFDFVATGEVLGERPMSQNKLSLDIVERESGLAGKLLRPLSAKLLPETVAETKGLVDRSKLGGISGRSRQPQLELAKQFGINDIPQPAGGCILTETDYGQRLKKLIQASQDFDGSDAQILRHCRPIWEGKLLFAVARHQADCAALKGLTKPGDLIFEPQNFPGPIVLARNFGATAGQEEIEPIGKKYLLQYSKKIPQNPDILTTSIKNSGLDLFL